MATTGSATSIESTCARASIQLPGMGANTLILEGAVIPDHSLVVGSPGRVVRTMSHDEVAGLRRIADQYAEHARPYLRSHAGPPRPSMRAQGRRDPDESGTAPRGI
jgi:hypothetical protein